MKTRRLPFNRPRMGSGGAIKLDFCTPSLLAADDSIGAGVTDTYTCGLQIADGVTLTIADTGILELLVGY